MTTTPQPEQPKGTPQIPNTVETITLGPWPVFFCNTNTAMRLRSHCHTAYVTVVYRTTGRVGFPSFLATNQPIRDRLRDLTGVEHPFRDATNEDVVRQLFLALDGWTDPEWESWGGSYFLDAVHLDVLGVDDKIGHDPGTTRYTIERYAS
ncbi:hypothetical protein JNW90_10765 [Micromonospora sp. STR1s_5]|nr:hypothetical protein [Micromonospora sp. STR1s_5]